MSFFTVNSDQNINDMLAYDLYRSFQSAVETIKQNGGTFDDVKKICDSFLPIDQTHPDTIDTPIPDIQDCKGEVIISCKYNMIGVALIGHSDGKPDIKDFELADSYHAFYRDALTKQYYYHEMNQKYAARNTFLENPTNVMEVPLMKFIELEVPFRLAEIHGIKDANQDLVDFITIELKKDNDVLFDYDAIDSFIERQIEKYQAEHRTKPLKEILSNIENKSTHDIKQNAAEKRIEERNSQIII